jgi:hypothetical protein
VDNFGSQGSDGSKTRSILAERQSASLSAIQIFIFGTKPSVNIQKIRYISRKGYEGELVVGNKLHQILP